MATTHILSCVAVLVILAQISWASLPCSTNRFRPCRVRINVYALNGTATSETSSEGCQCSRGRRCSNNWSSSSRVITRSLVSTNNRIVMDMMYCQPITPQRRCRQGEVALTLSGYFHIPTTIHQYNCDCSSSSPLQLTRKWESFDFKTYHDYVCNGFQSSCEPGGRCMIDNPREVQYPCACADDERCVAAVDGNRRGTIYGYCRP